MMSFSTMNEIKSILDKLETQFDEKMRNITGIRVSEFYQTSFIKNLDEILKINQIPNSLKKTIKQIKSDLTSDIEQLIEYEQIGSKTDHELLADKKGIKDRMENHINELRKYIKSEPEYAIRTISQIEELKIEDKIDWLKNKQLKLVKILDSPKYNNRDLIERKVKFWLFSEKQFEKNKDQEWTWKSFLNGKQQEIVIAASSGMGKSYLVKNKIKSTLETYSDKKDHFPIFLQVKNKSDGIESLLLELLQIKEKEGYTLQSYISTYFSGITKIVLFVDGMNKFSQEKIIEEKFNLKSILESPSFKLKIVYTTTRENNLDGRLGIDTFVEPCLYSEKNVYNTIKNIQVSLKQDPPSENSKEIFEKLKKIMKENIFCNPFYCELIARNYHEKILTILKQDEFSKIIETIILFYNSPKTNRSLLRKIAALMKIDEDMEGTEMIKELVVMHVRLGESTTSNIKEDYDDFEKWKKNLLKNHDLKPTLDDWIKHVKVEFSKNRKFSKKFEKDWKEQVDKIKHPLQIEIDQWKKEILKNDILVEYLLAEYFLESLALGRIERLNLGMPSLRTINFLKGLLMMLNKGIKEDYFITVLKKRSDEPIKFLILEKLNRTQFERKSLTKNFIKNVRRSIINDDLVFMDIKTSKDKSDPVELIEPDVTSLEDKFKHYFIHRWISFFISQNFPLIHDEEKCPFEHKTSKFTKWEYAKKPALGHMIKYTSVFVNPYLKNFEEVDLSDIDLSYSDLSEAIIKKTNFNGANLSHVDLSSSSIGDEISCESPICVSELDDEFDENLLIGPKFNGAELFHTDFENAIIPNSDFSNSFLWQCDFVGTKVHNSLFKNAKFQHCRIHEDTDLREMRFSNLGILATDFKKALGIKGTDKENQIQELLDNFTKAEEEVEQVKKVLEKLLAVKGIRHISIVNKETLEIYHQVINPNMSAPFLTSKDKTILIHYASLSLEVLNILKQDFGSDDLKSFVIEYVEIKVAVLQIGSLIVLITTKPLVDQTRFINWIRKNVKYCTENIEYIPHINKFPIQNKKGGWSVVKKEKFLEQELAIKSNSKYLEIGYSDFSNIFKVLKNDKEILKDLNQKELFHNIVKDIYIFNKDHSEEETDFQHTIQIPKKMSSELWRRWNSRIKFKKKIGHPKYAISSYSEKTLITTLISKNEKLLVVIADKAVDKNINKIKLLLEAIISIRLKT